MSLIYNPHDIFIVQRNADSSSFEEVVLTSLPNSYVGFDSASNLIAISESSSQVETASYAFSSSICNTASFAITYEFIGNVTHSLYADTASLSLASSLTIEAGENIPLGSVVYINGTDIVTEMPLAYLALADGTGLHDGVVGISAENISSGSRGFVVTSGVINGLNTLGYGSGDIIYLSPTTSGSWTITQPNDPHEKIIVGIILI